MTTSIIEHFSPLKDPRIERNKKHELIDIIVLSVCAICSGANGWEAIEEFGHEKLEWLILLCYFKKSHHIYSSS